MQANHKRKIKSGAEFNHLFPRPEGEEIEIKKDADVNATINFIPKVVLETLNDTKGIAKFLKADTLNETCSNIWHFVYNHIQYAKDQDGIEQIRRPSRTWNDKTRGVDCDCYTVFISSILTNLGIDHKYRITKYKNRNYFQHIYPIVPTSGANYITIDCVVNRFNYEEPFTEKKDTNMKLHYLNGIETNQNQSLMAIEENADTLDLMGHEDYDDLGRLKLFKRKSESSGSEKPAKGGIFKKILGGAKKVLHVVNRVNPGMALLRLGILASMKLNIFKIAGRIRYAYLSDEKAKAKDMDMEKMVKLKSILKKLEDIFYGAGGKPENLKKAILTGKGNKDHEVNGLGYISDDRNYDENTPLSELLSGIYEDETMDGLGELGEPITGAALATAASAMGLIASLIKKIGGMKKGGKDVPAGEEGSASEGGEVTDEDAGSNERNGGGGSGGGGSSHSSSKVMKRSSSNSSGDSDSSSSSEGETQESGDDNNSDGFLGKAKSWVKEHPMLTAAVGIAAVAGIYFGVKHFSKPTTKAKGLSGVYRKKHKKKKAKGKRKKRGGKKVIALL